MTNTTPIAALQSTLDRFKSTLSRIDEALLGSDYTEDVLKDVCRILGQLPGYTGVYIYVLEGDTLVLTAFEGRKTQHVRIPAGTGICGASVQSKAPVIVDDVASDARYLACNLETKSEIVVPILRDGLYLAQIDIDSDDRAAFDTMDEAFLSEVAQRICPLF